MGTRRKLNIVVDAEYNGGQEIATAAGSIERIGLEADIASQKEAKFTAKQKELAAAVAKGARTFDDAAKELKDYREELESGASKSDRAKESLIKIAKAGAALGVALGGAAIAAQKAWATIGEGAALIATEEKFGNLAGSIDTTADALLGKMREATKGMVSDAELLAAGTDIISLGLANTEEGVVRMSAAVGALNLDMGVLALTLANDSTARLDSLGLSLEDVTAKKKELIASGFIGDAFDEAVLIALEEKMVLLGDASETTAGQMAIVEAQAANLTAEFKIMAATTAGPLISSLSTAVTGQNKLNDGIDAGVITTKEWNQIINESESIAEGQAKAIEVVNRRLGEQTDATDKANKEAADYLAYQIAISGGLEDTTTAVTGLTLAQIYGAAAQEDANEAAKQSLRITAQNAFAIEQDTEARQDATDAMKKQRDAIQSVRDEQEKATAATGDYFTEARKSEDALLSWNTTVTTTGGLTSEQTSNLSDLRNEQEKILGTISSLQGGTAGLGLSSDDLNEKLGEQYEALSLVEGAMAPLAGVTAEITSSTSGWAINQDAINNLLYDAADASGASAIELGKMAIASGESVDDVIEDLKNAKIAAEATRLGEAIAAGMDPAEAQSKIDAYIAKLNEQDFRVELGIDIAEETTKSSDKSEETFRDFSDKAEEATDFAKGFFSDFSDDASIKMDDFGVSIDNVGQDFFNATTEAGKLKDMIIMGIPDEKIVKIKIVTEGSIPSGLTNGNTSATTTGVSQDIGH